MVDVLIIFLILSFLVLIHEWGHYIVAKKTGTNVEEFGFGYPPRARVLFTRKGTLFTLNWLPFGGFVKLAGDEGETFEGKPTASAEKSGDFSEKSSIARLTIIIAGAAMNILFAIFAFAVIYSKIGIPVILAHPVVDEVSDQSPAMLADIRAGDEIVLLDGEGITSTDQLIQRIGEKRGTDVELQVVRSGETLTKRLYIRTAEETPEGEGSLGVALGDMVLKQYPWWQMPFRGVVQGTRDSFAFSRLILETFKSMIVRLFTAGEIPKDISGPIGIVHAAQSEKIFSLGPLAILNVAAVISLNLGTVNLLPIPALDGGRAMFILLERFIGKRRRARVEGYANMVGMAVLLGLIVLISFHDVLKILR